MYGAWHAELHTHMACSKMGKRREKCSLKFAYQTKPFSDTIVMTLSTSPFEAQQQHPAPVQTTRERDHWDLGVRYPWASQVHAFFVADEITCYFGN